MDVKMRGKGLENEQRQGMVVMLIIVMVAEVKI